MTDHNNYSRAQDHLDAVHAARHRLTELYSQRYTDSAGKAIAETHQAIGHGLKVAEVHASLAVADELAGIAQELRDRLPLTGAEQ